MLECIKFGDRKVKTIQIRNKWFVNVHHIVAALAVSSDTLIIYLCSISFQERKLVLISLLMAPKLFTTVPRAHRVILGSAHPDGYDILDFLVERHNHLQDQAWEAQKTEHAALDNSIPIAKNSQEYIHFVFKLGKPALLGSKRNSYEYACILRYPWHMENWINNFHDKHLDL